MEPPLSKRARTFHNTFSTIEHTPLEPIRGTISVPMPYQTTTYEGQGPSQEMVTYGIDDVQPTIISQRPGPYVSRVDDDDEESGTYFLSKYTSLEY